MGRRITEAQEARATEADLTAQETGSAAIRLPRLAPTYLHATHPDTGLPVTFVPGEALPEWAPDA